MSSSSPVPETPFSLLPWQILFIFYSCGLLALRYPGPAVFSAAVVFVLQHKFNKLRVTPYLAAVCIIAGYCMACFQYPAGPIQTFQWMSQHKKVLLEAKIADVKPEPQNRLQIILSGVKFRVGNERSGTLPGKVAWTWENPDSWPCPGQTVQGRFKLKAVRGFQNPGTWNSKFYWKSRGVFYKTYTEKNEGEIEIRGEKSFFWSLRLDLRNNIIRHTGKGEARGLILALTMGDRSQLSYSTLELIRRASLAHTLALSGLHLGFLITFAWMLAWLCGLIRPQIYFRIPRTKLALLIALPLVLGYIWLGQARPSLLRAGLMFFFWGILLLRGKDKVLLDGLFFAACSILLVRPLDIFDLSLQMSCAAVAGIILFWPLLQPVLKKLSRQNKILSWIFLPLTGILVVSAIANLVLLPIIVWHFGRITPAIYTNLFWLPAIGWIVLPLGLSGLVLGLLPCGELLAGACLSAAENVLQIMLSILKYLDTNGLIHVLIALRPLWPEILGFWILMGSTAIFWKKAPRIPWWLIILVFALLSYPSLQREMHNLDPRITLRVLDVGQGQSVCMEFSQGERVLVDGGGSWNPDFDLGEFAVAPALTWNRAPRIEKIILTHPDYDHLRGLYYILKHFEVQEFIFNGDWPENQDKIRLKKALRISGADKRIVHNGKKISINSEVALRVLHPKKNSTLEKINNRSLVLRLTHEDKGLALLPGDLERLGINRLLERNATLNSQVLVVPHHGARGSRSRRFYSRVNPEIALISCGYLNYFRMPHKEITNLLKKMGISTYSTSGAGQIQVIWDLDSSRKKVYTYQGK